MNTSSCFSLAWTVVLLLTTVVAPAQPKQQLSVPGLQAPVEVLRDQWGINHIYASNQHDLFFAQGYCAATDRLFQFEIWRRQAIGTVAEILGPQELKRDIGTRLFLYRGDMQKELNHYHPQGAAIINAYVEGVNAYIEKALQHPADLPVEFALLHIKPQKWTPAVVISRHQGLLGNIEEELATARAVARVGEAKVKDLSWFHPKDPDLALDPSITGDMLAKNILELYEASHRPIDFANENLSAATSYMSRPLPEHGAEGSNNWVVSGSKTASGLPLLANDPHRAISLPSLRYMVHLVAPGWNVMGGGEPEIPGVSIGHNEHGAWGLTIFETDGEDLYVYDLNPANLSQYRYKNRWVNMKEIRETVRVKDEGPVGVSLNYTVHGPVTFIDTANRKAYAVKCAWLEPGGAPYLASLRIDQAKNWDEFRTATKYSHIPGENMIWADKSGSIGWQVVGIVPIRKKSSGLVPVPGDGRFEWEGYLPMTERPHVLNPAKGFFATANQHVTPDSYAHWNAIGFTWADPYRGNRINEVLAAGNHLTRNDMKALQTDYFSIPARTLVPMLQTVDVGNGAAAKAKAELAAWNFVLDKNSVAAGIYAMWERKLKKRANEQLVPAEVAGLISVQLKKLIDWLGAPGNRFGPGGTKDRDAFLRETFNEAVAELGAKLGPDPAGWTYGQKGYKHTALNGPLSVIVPTSLKEKYNLGPLPRGGNGNTPNSTGDADRQGSGASFRLIADLQDWDKTLLINSPGQSGDVRSPYYSNLFAMWANNDYFPGYFSREKIRGVTDKQTILKPVR